MKHIKKLASAENRQSQIGTNTHRSPDKEKAKKLATEILLDSLKTYACRPVRQ